MAGGVKVQSACGVAGWVLASCFAAAAPARAHQAVPEAPPATSTSPVTTPPRRTIDLTVPLVRNAQVLGDVLVQLSPDGASAIETQSLRAEMGSLLNDLGRQRLEEAIAGRPYIAEAELQTAGFTIRFDQTRLEVVVEQIEGSLRPAEVLGDAQPTEPANYLPTIEASEFSAYLNINANLDYQETLGLQNPDLFFSGAARYQNVVLEYDLAITESLEDRYKFYRRGVRAVYDQREQYRRFSAGDLRLNTLPILRTPFIGGVAVERSRQVFDPYAPISRFGGRSIFLDTPSTVDVIINGSLYQSFQLNPGTYDLSQLPIRYGSNDVQLRVRDAAGRQQLLNFNYFFEPLDLNAGDVEYVAGFGVLSRELSFQPDYTNDPVFVGSYRRALTDQLILGGATQITEDVQVFAGEVSIVPQVIPGSFRFQGAVSTGDGTGYAARVSWRWRDGDIEAQRQFTLSADYQSDRYRNVGFIPATGFEQYSINASYSQALSRKLTVVVGANYTGLGGSSDITNVFVDAVYLISDRFRLNIGAEYGDDDFYDSNWGVRLGFTVLFGPRTRGSADYRSRTETARASISRGADPYVGSFGYDLSVDYNQGESSVNGNVDYIGNRFTARAFVQSRGDGFGDVTDEQRVRLQVGTSLAFAGGSFGIGRPIGDSFALVRPHRTLRDKNVIVGRALQGENYEASSGPLGAAVLPRLSSYNTQDIQYDIDSLEPGYDIGAGVVRVDPPFRSGYEVIVGSDRFVSALGNLNIGGAPAELAAGRITGVDDEGFAEQSFFTNSAGRFGIVGLAPGKTYIVRLNSGQQFTITVPADNTGLFRMGTVEIPSTGQ